MNDNSSKEEKGLIPKPLTSTMKRSIIKSLSEDNQTRKNKKPSSGSGGQNDTKKSEQNCSKEKYAYHTNIPLPINLIKSRSLEKNNKPDTPKKTSETEGKKKLARPKTAVEKRKRNPKDKEFIPDNNLKPVNVSKSNTSIQLKKNFKNEVQNTKNEVGCKVKKFEQLLPLIEKEFQKIENTWLNAIYSSLTLRANQFKFLLECCPNIDKSQFLKEDQKLNYCFDQVKVFTKAEANNLMDHIKGLLIEHDKIKTEYQNLMKKDKESKKKATPSEEDSKNFKSGAAETQPEKSSKKKDVTHTPCDQLSTSNLSKQTENILEGYSSSDSEEVNDIRVEANNLPTLQRELQSLKSKYSAESKSYEKKIQTLEALLEEKIKLFQQERETKLKLQACLTKFEEQKKRIIEMFGSEGLEQISGMPFQPSGKRRELWLSSTKLLFKGFLTQVKDLESERDKILTLLQNNGTQNFKDLVAFITEKDNFIKCLKEQIRSFGKELNVEIPEVEK